VKRDHLTYQVAWLAAQTHISPTELLALDEPMFRALRAVVMEKGERNA